MPFASQAQQGWAHAHPDEFGKKNLAEFDAATKGMHDLPEHKGDGRKKMADEKKDKKKHAKHGHKHTHVEHHPDGSHTVRHQPEDGGPEKSYAAADLPGLMAGMQSNLGPEAEAAPAEAAAPPPVPVASA